MNPSASRSVVKRPGATETSRSTAQPGVAAACLRLSRAALQFTDADSGTEGSPVRYQAHPGEVVRLSGAEILTNFTPFADPEILQRLDPAARGHVLQSDLRTLGLTNFGTAAGGGLATPVDVRGTKGCVEGVFKYEGERPRRWIREPDVWLHGYWFWDWSDQRQQQFAGLEPRVQAHSGRADGALPGRYPRLLAGSSRAAHDTSTGFPGIRLAPLNTLRTLRPRRYSARPATMCTSAAREDDPVDCLCLLHT